MKSKLPQRYFTLSLIVAAFLLTSFSPANFAEAIPCSATSCLTVTNYSCAVGGWLPAVLVTYKNNTFSGLTAIAFAVMHNSLNQTIYYTTATLRFTDAGQELTAYFVLAGLPHGVYSVEVFALYYPSGVAMSPTVTISCAI
jgi:hypothetical protein